MKFKKKNLEKGNAKWELFGFSIFCYINSEDEKEKRLIWVKISGQIRYSNFFFKLEDYFYPFISSQEKSSYISLQ